MSGDFTLSRDERLLVAGMRDCHCVGHPHVPAGRTSGKKPCPTCKGTGNGIRGGRNGCKACHGLRTTHDWVNHVECSQCKGTTKIPTTFYDYVPRELLAEVIPMIPVVIHRSGRPQTWSEAHLGLGCIVSVTDYGAHQNLTGADFEAKIRVDLTKGGMQALNICDKATGKLVDVIVADCSRNGYSLRGYHGAPKVMANTSDYRQLGMDVFNAGGNGVMAAGLADNLSLVSIPTTIVEDCIDGEWHR